MSNIPAKIDDFDDVETPKEPVVTGASLEDFANDLEDVLTDSLSVYSQNGSTDSALPENTESHAVSSMPTDDELDMFIAGFDDMGETFHSIEAMFVNLKARSRTMGSYSRNLKKQSATYKEARKQLTQFQSENQQLHSALDRSRQNLDDRETDLATAKSTISALRAELSQANSIATDLETRLAAANDATERATAAQEDSSRVASEAKATIVRMNAELASLRAAKAEMSVELRTSKNELSGVRSRVAELELQNEKVTNLHSAMSVEREKAVEERKLLRRELGALETEVAELKIKSERLVNENNDLVGRMAAERFSFEKSSDALASELNLIKERNNKLEAQSTNMHEHLEAERAEREKALVALRDNAASLEDGRRQLSRANLSISELNLKYGTDLLTMDQLRDEVTELRNRIKTLQMEKNELAEYQIQAKLANARADKLEERLADYVQGISGTVTSEPVSTPTPEESVSEKQSPANDTENDLSVLFAGEGKH